MSDASVVREFAGARVFVLGDEGPLLAAGRDAIDLISAAFSEKAILVAVPVCRLSPEFFSLRTGLAGEFVQKFVNYGTELAIVGDISPYTEASDAFRDFVREANRGSQLAFVDDLAALEARLHSAKP